MFLGHHNHPQPPIKKPFPVDKELFAKRIKAAPDTRPLKLKVGQSLQPGHVLGPVRNISEAFNNLDRITYYRRAILQGSGIVTESTRKHSDDSFIFFSMFQRDHPNFVQHTNFTSKIVIILQTDWMKAQLRELIREDRDGNLGTLTDTTYSYFKSGFLLSSSLYNHILRRWVPVVLSFIGREDDNHIKEHFKFLITKLKEVIPKEKFSQALDQVVDFSAAQNKGFRNAYIELHMEIKLIMEPDMSDSIKASYRNELDAEASSHLKGCAFHYR